MDDRVKIMKGKLLSLLSVFTALTLASCELHITVSDEISSEESVAIEGIASAVRSI